MASVIFDVASDGIAKQTLDWDGATTVRVILIKGGGQPLRTNATVLAALAEASVDEADATNYVRKTLANPVVTTTGGKTLFDGDNPVWTALGGASNNTISGALFYIGTNLAANDSTNLPIAYIDTADLTTNGGDVTLTKDATNKWFYLNNPT
jgi:hypothetical protein